MTVHGDAAVYISSLAPGESVKHEIHHGRGCYLYAIEGEIDVNGERMSTGDAARIWDEPMLEIAASSDAELILVDVNLNKRSPF